MLIIGGEQLQAIECTPYLISDIFIGCLRYYYTSLVTKTTIWAVKESKNTTKTKKISLKKYDNSQKNATKVKKIPLESKNTTKVKNYHNNARKLKIYHKIQKSTFLEQRDVYDCNTNQPDKLVYVIVSKKVRGVKKSEGRQKKVRVVKNKWKGDTKSKESPKK